MKSPAFVACLVFVAGLAFQSTPNAAEIKLHAASFQPESVSFAKYFYRWVREVNARCDGQLEITVTGPEEIPSELQWHALKEGRVDLYYGPANYYRGALPHADVLNLGHNEPADQRRNGAWEIMNALHNELLNAWYLTSLSSGIQFFIYTTKPANDGRFNGFRLRAVPLYEGFLRTLGAKPQYMPASAVLTALEDGSIDGYGWPLWSGGHGWEEFVKYRYGPGFLSTASPILVNLDKWKALTDGQRQCLTDMAIWVETEWPKWRATEDTLQLEMLEEAGVEFVDLGAEFARKPEEIYWGMLNKAQPDYVRKVKPMFTSDN